VKLKGLFANPSDSRKIIIARSPAMKQADSSKILGLQRNISFSGTATSWLAAILFSGFFSPKAEK
jgi:hypothetical protein